jgi:hypothetical protein
MSVETKLVTLLAGTVGVSNLVGARIYPATLPQNPTLPAITYMRVTSGPVYSITGYSGLDNPHMQIDCWASTYSAAKALRAAVLTAIDGATTLKGVLISDQDMYEDDVMIYRVSMDFSLWSKEP